VPSTSGTTDQSATDPVHLQTSAQALSEVGKEFYATWYPTLEHTLKLLFKLYYTVDVSTPMVRAGSSSQNRS